METGSSKILKDLDQLWEENQVLGQAKNDDTPLPFVLKIDESKLATGKSPVKTDNLKLKTDNLKIDVPLLLPELPSWVPVTPTRDETYQSASEDEDSKKMYPSLVINAALRWYESNLEQGGILLFDWVRGQFQCFKNMQTYKHQKTFLKLHRKNIKRLLAGLLKLLPLMKAAGIAHNNINLETIMLHSLAQGSQKDDNNLFAFIGSPPWYPLLTSFGCASLTDTWKQAFPLTQRQFHKLIKDYSPVVLDIKASNIIFSYYRDFTNYPRYLAPEKNPVTPKGDLWALGVLLWECLTNTFLWEHPGSKRFHHMVIKNGFKIWFVNHVKIRENDHLPYFVPDDALDLLHRIFKIEAERISVDGALNHAFFRGVKVEPARTSVDMNAFSLEIQTLSLE